jgi:hypothetical protein
MTRSRWEYVHKEIHKGDPMETIVFIRDLDLGGRSVTNDAENVVTWWIPLCGVGDRDALLS